MTLYRHAAPLLLLALSLAGCGGGSDEPANGACVHIALEPVLRIASVTDDLGTSLPTVTVSNVSLYGLPIVGDSLTQGAVSATRQGDVLTCTLPCGLFETEGAYELTLSAPGHVARTVTINATYSSFTGGCPSYNAGSTVFSTQLTRGSR